MTAIEAQRAGRLSRRLYEASIIFALATLIALFVLFAVGARTNGRFACAARSIVTSSARCTGAAEIGREIPSGTINVIFSADPRGDLAER